MLVMSIEQDFDFFEVTLTIIEIKKGKINLQALGQISRYKVGLEDFLSTLPRKRKKLIKIDCVLLGFKYADDDAWAVVKNCSWIDVIFYDISFSGITFEAHNGFYFNKFGSADKILSDPKIAKRYLDSLKVFSREKKSYKKYLRSRLSNNV